MSLVYYIHTKNTTKKFSKGKTNLLLPESKKLLYYWKYKQSQLISDYCMSKHPPEYVKKNQQKWTTTKK